MESTIRFTSSGYQCKQLNLVTTQDSSGVSIENISGNNVISVNESTNIQLQVDKDDTDFTLTIKNVGVVSGLSTGSISKKISSFIGFGYPHAVCGIPFVISVTSTPKDLVITKTNGTVSIVYDGNDIDSIKDVKGPILDMSFNIADKNLDGSEFVNICLGDIIYTSN